MWKRFLTITRLSVFLLLLFELQVSATTYAQRDVVTINERNVSLEKLLWTIEQKSDFVFFYSKEDINSITNLNVVCKDKLVTDILTEVLQKTNLVYEITHNTIVLKRIGIPQEKSDKITVIEGVVVDSEKLPLPGVTVKIKGTAMGCVTDADGKFKLPITEFKGVILVFSFIGMETKEVQIKDLKKLSVVLYPSDNEIDEVVVTGIYSRNNESFTGSAKTFRNKDLKMVGTKNLLQSIKSLDPSFVINENNQYGSDPNRLPDIEIRGKTTIVGLKEQYGEDPNQPLFILDGFETTLQTIMDLSLDRIASVTILKDAASTAIYGSKAANGVMVVETKSPEQGKLRVSYNGSLEFSFPDLHSYNLMNSSEKLEFEKLSGRFKSNLPANQEFRERRYNMLLAEIERGVDTYWLSEPLRNGLNQRHSLYIEGGDKQVRYGLGADYSGINGVMKESDRDTYSVNLDLIYRVGKLSFTNKATFDHGKTSNPTIGFSSYSRANPYYRKYNEYGGVDKWLEYTESENAGGVNYESVHVANPLYNAKLNSYNEGKSQSIRDNIIAEYRFFEYLRLRGRIGVSHSNSYTYNFTSPENTRYDGGDIMKKGQYSQNDSESTSYSGDYTLTFGKVLAEDHNINAVLGGSFSSSKGKSTSFSVIGFPEGDFVKPGYANAFPEGSKPGYYESESRSVDFYLNMNYAYKNRYLMDLNLRKDGSSVFGSNKMFTNTWSVGLAWNLHNEAFIMDNTSLFSYFKIRASIGNPGNQNFGSFSTITTYRFNNWLVNNFGTGFLVDSFGDPDLKWQKTIDKNIGFDISMLNNRLHLNFDYYYKNTDPLMASVPIPSSVGVSSRLMNIGQQLGWGFTGSVKYAIIYKPKDRINWTTSINFRQNKGEYRKIGDALSSYNRENISKNLSRYYDGGSPTALWAVRSVGIDPATGRELFLTDTDQLAFNYNSDYEKVVGDTRPTLEGVWGNSLMYKGLSVSVYCRYSWGAKDFNNTLYEKVENISTSGLTENQDRRALYDRWQKPGDKAKYKGISLTESTPISSRFVMKNNFFTIESVRVGYEFPQEMMGKVGLNGMTLSAYMNDIARWGTIKEERGIDYPFARSFSFALSFNF